MKTERLAFFGGHFDPPGLHHINIVKKILENNLADKVIVVSSGFDEKKAYVPIAERRKLVELAFSGIDKVYIDYVNIDENKYLKYAEMKKCLGIWGGEIIYVLGAYYFHGGQNSLFISRWNNNKFIFENGRFIVVTRKGYNEENFLPPNCMVLETDGLGSSSEIRRRIKVGESIEDLVTPGILKYIKQNALYL